MRWSPREVQALERAIERGQRIVITRRGAEHPMVPIGLRHEGANEVLTARHVHSGAEMDIRLDEVEAFATISA